MFPDDSPFGQVDSEACPSRRLTHNLAVLYRTVSVSVQIPLLCDDFDSSWYTLKKGVARSHASSTVGLSRVLLLIYTELK